MRILKIAGFAVVFGVVVVYIAARFMPAPSSAPAPVVASKPAIPINVTLRKALAGQGAVAQFHNQADKIIPFTVEITRAGVQPFKRALVCDPGKAVEIGHMEGFALAPGDVVEISADGYRPSKTTLTQ